MGVSRVFPNTQCGAYGIPIYCQKYPLRIKLLAVLILSAWLIHAPPQPSLSGLDIVGARIGRVIMLVNMMKNLHLQVKP